jgi:hypothetical protein
MPLTLEGEKTALSIAIDAAGNLHLLAPVLGGPAIAMPPDLKGLKVRHRILETGEFLDLVATPSYEQVFNPVCKDVIDAIVRDRRDSWMAVAATVRAWQTAWKPILPEMDKRVQVGLFGELLVLRTLMIPCLGSAAVDQWSGPECERHDFVGERLHLEVKTTRKSRHEHEISRLDQLRVPEGRQLLLVSVQLEQSVGGSETLATSIDNAVDLLRSDAAALDRFMVKIANLGWSEEMRVSGELLRFFVRSAFIYPVDESFPRLPDDFATPSGVISVKYTIDLANLPALGMDEAIDVIRSANS